MQFRNMAGSSYGRRQEWEKNWDSNAIFIAENWWKLASSASKGSISPCLQAMSIRLNVSYFTPHQFTNVSLVISVLSDASYFSRAFFPTLYTVSFLLNKKIHRNPIETSLDFSIPTGPWAAVGGPTWSSCGSTGIAFFRAKMSAASVNRSICSRIEKPPQPSCHGQPKVIEMWENLEVSCCTCLSFQG